jgi:hypothetical protein
MYPAGGANKRKRTGESESTGHARCNRTCTTLHQEHRQNCCGVFGYTLAGSDAQARLFYPSRVRCAKTISSGCHCICRLINPSACIYHRNRLLTYRVQAVFSGNSRALYVPYVPCPWASYIFCQTSPRPRGHLAYHCSSRSFVNVSWMSAQLYSEPSSVRPL